jgi:hypothetical protein
MSSSSERTMKKQNSHQKAEQEEPGEHPTKRQRNLHRIFLKSCSSGQNTLERVTNDNRLISAASRQAAGNQ